MFARGALFRLLLELATVGLVTSRLPASEVQRDIEAVIDATADIEADLHDEPSLLEEGAHVLAQPVQKVVVDQDCEWDGWTEWTPCQFTCGGGTAVRTRKVKAMAQGHGKGCDANEKETKDCSKNACPVDCIWADWDSWGSCSATCGSGWTAKKRIMKQPAEYGGKACRGNMTINSECNTKACPVDCKWGEWNAWSACSKTCGSGERLRQRPVVQQKNEAGAECLPPSSQSEPCGLSTCPVDCQLEDWQPWDNCDATCGKGETQRVRKVLVNPTFGGRNCDRLMETKSCNSGLCPVHCIMGDWGSWGSCSTTCAGGGVPGTQKRYREVTQQANALGNQCDASMEQSTPCSTMQCPVDCEISDWAEWSECSTTCGSGIMERNREVTRPAQFGGKRCATTNVTYEKKYCRKDTCPVDCEWGDWQDWRACSTSCAAGLALRMRLQKTLVMHGGKECAGSSEQNRDCNLKNCPVHCQWEDWGTWTECTSSCGNGTQKRTRGEATRPDFGGLSCSGARMVSKTCGNQPCPIACTWKEWSDWGSCSTSCNNGTKTRTREVDVPAQFGGAECDGSVSSSVPCENLLPCPADCAWADWDDWMGCTVTCGSGFTRRNRNRKAYEKDGGHVCYGTEDEEQVCTLDPCPVNCIMGDWSDWTECSKTCGYDGSRLRARNIKQKGSLGGKMCNFNDLNDKKSCDISPCPIHCQWSEWGEWSKCSKECAGGQTYRYRSENVSAEHGGSSCDGSADEQQVCNAGGCPIDCKWSEWTEWSECPKTCGGSTKLATRRTVNEAQWGGAPCEGLAEKKETCNDVACPIDCVWSPWSRFSLCSETCGGGKMNRTRSSMKEQFGGAPCVGGPVDSKPCNSQGCPRDCLWAKWTEWTACSAKCGGGKLKRFRDVAVRKANGGDPCVGAALQEADCNLNACPIHCDWNSWSEWSPCTKTCGGGVRKKSRSKAVKAANGGLPCLGNSTDSKTCNADPCPVDCTFEDWTEWGDCSTSCGTGKRFRTRVKKDELYGGRSCEETMAEIGICVNEEFLYGCPTTTDSTTSSTTTMTNAEGVDGWTNKSSHWDPYVYKGVQKHATDQNSVYNETKNPKTGKPFKPCAKDKLKKKMKEYVDSKVAPEAPENSTDVQTIDKVITEITGELPTATTTTTFTVTTTWHATTTSNMTEVAQILNETMQTDKEVTIDQVEHLLDHLPNKSDQLKSIIRKAVTTTTMTTTSTATTTLTMGPPIAALVGDMGLWFVNPTAFLKLRNVEKLGILTISQMADVLPISVHVKVAAPKKDGISLIDNTTTENASTAKNHDPALPDANVNIHYRIEVGNQPGYRGDPDAIASHISHLDMAKDVDLDLAMAEWALSQTEPVNWTELNQTKAIDMTISVTRYGKPVVRSENQTLKNESSSQSQPSVVTPKSPATTGTTTLTDRITLKTSAVKADTSTVTTSTATTSIVTTSNETASNGVSSNASAALPARVKEANESNASNASMAENIKLSRHDEAVSAFYGLDADSDMFAGLIQVPGAEVSKADNLHISAKEGSMLQMGDDEFDLDSAPLDSDPPTRSGFFSRMFQW